MRIFLQQNYGYGGNDSSLVGRGMWVGATEVGFVGYDPLLHSRRPALIPKGQMMFFKFQSQFHRMS